MIPAQFLIAAASQIGGTERLLEEIKRQSAPRRSGIQEKGKIIFIFKDSMIQKIYISIELW